MSGRAGSEVSAARCWEVWRQHEDGTPGRVIARNIGIAEGTVRYYLRQKRPAGLPARPTRDKPRDKTPRSDADSRAVVTHLADRRQRA